MGTAIAAVPVPDDLAQILKRADSIKTSNHAEFAALMQRLEDGAAKLSPEQQLYLRYLNAWQFAYRGDYPAALPLLNAVISESTDATLRFRAGVTAVNLLGIATHYEEAFSRLNQLLDQLPRVTDKDARVQALGAASQLYIQAGQYDLSAGYADQLLKESSSAANACKATTVKLEALYRSGKLERLGRLFQDGIDLCVEAGEPIFANAIRSYVAAFDIQQDQPAAAIKLLQNNYATLQSTRYTPLISRFDASLAQAYWKEGEFVLAQQFALEAVNSRVKNEYTEPLTTAYELLYLISQKQGDMGSALAYHEKYMAADKGYLTEVSAKVLAYQTVKQQVLAKKLQIDTLNKQNQILELQQTLGKKAAVTSRLYIILLLTVLASIALWTYRIKRSQLRFMKLARRDGLTGIFNRQHFVEEVEHLLLYCKKSARDACIVLIDLDHFKIVNDTHGHAVGDRVLRRAVEACQAHLRSTDVFGRLGGEEFGILLPDCSLEQAYRRAEQIRVAIATAATGENAPGIPISASFGVAVTSRSGYELRGLLIHADEALYRAKREGRNRVVVSDEVEACLKTG
ncbi:GGDEF domain-containing protein [Rhodanobacter sp. MP7CTX1]|uniref:tetratricopeptide repeat-containing diguanylate cyclase n=1 Tax=Rhodanobacter sp. MP7CTX1 TaxID=2723084 RepID=UPI0018031EC7|nr:GGDEF domain-containing protein [Rhodanobacter sp. MP7CTX1]MBB6188613.1 diguanylate cyclase (GGDEF)-like protein [Rhodanobacter sp. MP7CTX1]